MSTNATSGPLHLREPLEADAVVDTPAAREPLVAKGAKPHICFVATTTWPVLSGDTSIPVVGGAEVQQSVIAPGLARRGWRVSMISLDYGQPDRAVVKGVTVHKIHKPDEGLPGLRFLHPRFTSLWRGLKRVDADIYYVRTADVILAYVAMFCGMRGRRSVYAGASNVDFMPGSQEIRFTRDRHIFQWGLRRVDEVIVQNEEQRAALAANFGRAGTIIPSCYIPPATARCDPAGYVLWSATMRPAKRPALLLDIARRLPRYRFVMLGGPMGRRGEEYMRSFAEAAASVPNVEVRGFVPFSEAERAFDGARVVINTSSYEGFPNTFLQAWARGVPTLAFVDTGSRRAGEPVYDIAADTDDAVRRLERLMDDDHHWTSASRRVAAHFRDEHSIEAVLDRYEQALASGGRAR